MKIEGGGGKSWTKGNAKQFLICSLSWGVSGSLAIGLGGLDKSCSRRLFGCAFAFMSNENVGLMLSKFNCLCRNTLANPPFPPVITPSLLPHCLPLCGVNPTTKSPTWRTRVFVLSQQQLPRPVLPSPSPSLSACHYPIHPNPLQAEPQHLHSL